MNHCCLVNISSNGCLSSVEFKRKENDADGAMIETKKGRRRGPREGRSSWSRESRCAARTHSIFASASRLTFPLFPSLRFPLSSFAHLFLFPPRFYQPVAQKSITEASCPFVRYNERMRCAVLGWLVASMDAGRGSAYHRWHQDTRGERLRGI